MSNRELCAQLYGQLKDTDVTTLSDDQLDQQIVELGGVSNWHAPTGLDTLLEKRKEERWTRKQRQTMDIIRHCRVTGNWSELREIIDAERTTETLNRFVGDVYEDTLATAITRKQELDATGRPYHEFIEAQIYAEEFAGESSSLFDVLMDTEMMLEKFCPITFELRNGQDLIGPTREEALAADNRFSPLQERDALLSALFSAEYADTPLTVMPFPLKRLFLAHHVALQDIGSIHTYGSTLESWRGTI